MTDHLDTILDLRHRLVRMLEAGGATPPSARETFTPPLDVVHAPGGLTITVELPGMAREEIDVELHGNMLTISGERKTRPCEGQQCLRRERRGGRFKRSLALPTSDHNELSAALKDGVLTIKVQRS